MDRNTKGIKKGGIDYVIRGEKWMKQWAGTLVNEWFQQQEA